MTQYCSAATHTSPAPRTDTPLSPPPHLRSLQQAKGGARERAQALLNFKFRVLQLLEDYAKRCPASPHLLKALPQLLAALARSSRPGGSGPLADRIRGLLENKACRGKVARVVTAEEEGSAEGVSRAELEQALKKVLYYASREKDPRVTAAGGQVLLYMLRSAAAAGGWPAEVAAAVAATAVGDYFAKSHKCRLQRRLLEELFAKAGDAAFGQAALPSGQQPAAALVMQYCCKARSDYLQVEALQLLADGVFKAAGAAAGQPQPQAQQDALRALVKSHTAQLSAALSHAVTGPFRTKDRHATAVRCARACLDAAKKLQPGKRLAEVLGPETLNALAKGIVTVRELELPDKVTKQLDSVVAAAGLQELVARTQPDAARLQQLKKAIAKQQQQAQQQGGKPTKVQKEGEQPKQPKQQDKRESKPGKQQKQKQQGKGKGSGKPDKQQKQKQRQDKKAGQAASDKQQAGSKNGAGSAEKKRPAAAEAKQAGKKAKKAQQ
jgi:hypothetical protein